MNTARWMAVIGSIVIPAAGQAGDDRLRPPSDVFGIMAVPADKRSPEALADLGVGWVRFSSQMGERAREARMFEQAARRGYGMWLTISHRDRGNVIEEGTVGFRKAARGGFEPRDMERYKDLVRETIRPIVNELRRRGKRPEDWLVVQVENEVLPVEVYPPDRPRRFWHGDADGYLRTLNAAYEAVKSVDPSIPVAAFGFSSEMLEEFVIGRHPKMSAWGEKVLRDGRFDWADAHLYHRIEDIPAKIAWIKDRWRGSLAATEVGGPDPAVGGDPSDEEDIAKDLPKRMQVTLDAGVDRVFWVLLVETPGTDERFRKMGLIDRAWRRRPVFDSYRTLIR